MDILTNRFRTLLRQVPKNFVRGLFDKINWDARAVCIEGTRGTGKIDIDVATHSKVEITGRNTLHFLWMIFIFENIHFRKLRKGFINRVGGTCMPNTAQ